MGEPGSHAFINDVSEGGDMQRTMAVARRFLPRGMSLPDYVKTRSDVVRHDVEKIIRRLDGADAFDVLELLRTREIVAAGMGFEEPDIPASRHTVEIAAVALLARGQRLVGDTSAPADRAQKSTEMLHIVGAELLGMGSFSALAAAESEDPWTRLIARYRLLRLTVRSMHYSDIDDELNRRLFGAGELAEQLAAKLGFILAEFAAVRAAVREQYWSGLNSGFQDLEDLSESWGATRDAGAITEEQKDQARAALDAMMIRPGNRASFTAEDIAARAELDPHVVKRVLDLFAVPFAEANPVEAVDAYLNGANPFASSALIRDADGRYLQLVQEIGDDSYRQMIERSVAREEVHQLYNKHRGTVSEGAAGEYLRRMLGTGSLVGESYHYYAPKDGYATADLGPTAVKPTTVGKDCEGDLLFVIDDVAIVVEVKAASLSPGARSTRDDYFEREIEKTLGAGTEQARRAADLIRVNGGLWQPGGQWLNLSHVREIRTVLVTFEDLGTLSSDAAGLAAAGIMPAEEPSWIVNAYDLAVIAELLDDRAEFLLYLRRRTDPDTATRWRAMDELDLVMLYLQDLLAHQPDPSRIRSEYPDAPPPDDDAQFLWDDQPGDAQVGNYTGRLDAWWAGRTGQGPKVAKPAIELDREDRLLVDAASRSKIRGASVAGADVLGLTVAQRLELHRLIGVVAAAAKRGDIVTERISLAGSSGAGVIVLRSAPRAARPTQIEEGLAKDLERARREWGADRALGFAIGVQGRPVTVAYGSKTIEAEFAHLRSPSGPPPQRKKRSRRRR